MAAARLPAPKNPIVFGALAIGALWFVTRARAQSAAVVGVRAQPGQSYATPTAVASRLAQAVVQLTKNLQTSPVKNADATYWGQTSIAGLSTGGAGSWAEFSDYAARQLGDPIFGWSAPVPSAVGSLSVSQYGTEVDQIPAAPVYSITNDYWATPPRGLSL